MLTYGFSTGALALGDFDRALAMLANQGTTAVELSALRDSELPELMQRIPHLDLSGFEHVSVHALSKLSTMTEVEAARWLAPCIENRWLVVVHPDVIQEPACWEAFGDLLCIENMDKRKSTGRTADELAPLFEALPRASFCLDLGHARQVDASLSIARELLSRFGDRVAQIHLSELDAKSRHRPLSMASVFSLAELSFRLPDVAVILEAETQLAEIQDELRMARNALVHGCLRETPRAGTQDEEARPSLLRRIWSSFSSGT